MLYSSICLCQLFIACETLKNDPFVWYNPKCIIPLIDNWSRKEWHRQYIHFFIKDTVILSHFQVCVMAWGYPITNFQQEVSYNKFARKIKIISLLIVTSFLNFIQALDCEMCCYMLGKHTLKKRFLANAQDSPVIADQNAFKIILLFIWYYERGTSPSNKGPEGVWTLSNKALIRIRYCKFPILREYFILRLNRFAFNRERIKWRKPNFYNSSI